MANRIQDAFDSVKADSRLKESTKQFLREQYRGDVRSRRHPIMKRAVSVVCAMLFLVIGAVGYTWVQTPVSYVSIDVNPSIELALNRFDRVVDATAYNMEGEEILNGLSLKGKKYADAIDAVVQCDKMSAYRNDASEIVLTVAADESRERALEMGVRLCANHIGKSCHSDQTDLETVSKAHESGVSFGKYHAYMQLSEYDDTVTVDDCKEMSMAQIHEKIRECETHSEEHGNEEKEDPHEGHENYSDRNNSEHAEENSSDTTSHHGKKNHH